MYKGPYHRFRNIILTGMPCSGKTTFGRYFAHLSGRQFIDLDAYIERNAGRSIADIFANEGEEAFRQRESRCLRHFDRRNDCVIATGGGTLCAAHNMRFARSIGVVVFLRIPLETITKRIIARAAQHPVFAGCTTSEEIAARVEELWNRRSEYYESSDILLDTAWSSFDCLALELRAYESKTFNRNYQRDVASITGGMPHWRNVQGSYLRHSQQPQKGEEDDSVAAPLATAEVEETPVEAE